MYIGDQFKFSPNPYNKKCYYLNKAYTINSFSKSKLSVYYDFKVSNKRCKCYQCMNRVVGINSTGIVDIYIYQTKKEKERSIKLNRILKGVSF